MKNPTLPKHTSLNGYTATIRIHDAAIRVPVGEKVELAVDGERIRARILSQKGTIITLGEIELLD